MTRATEEEAELVTRLTSLRSECELSVEERREAEKLEESLASIDANIKKVAPNLKSLENEVTTIQKEIMDVGGPKLKRAQAKVDAVTAELTDLMSTLSTKQVEGTNTEFVGKTTLFRIQTCSTLNTLQHPYSTSTSCQLPEAS